MSQIRHVKVDKELRQHNLASVQSSQLLSTSRNDSSSQRILPQANSSHEPLSVSNFGRKALDAEDLYLSGQNKFGINLNHHQIQQPKIRKSLIYLRS